MKLPLHILFLQLLFLFTGVDSTALSPFFHTWETSYLKSPYEIGRVLTEHHLNITYNCRVHTVELLFRLTSQEYFIQTPWALQTIDSWGKFPEDILLGHLNSLGDYDECANVDVTKSQFLGFVNRAEKYSTKFRGLYCTVALHLPVLALLPSATKNAYLDESNSGDVVEKLMNYLTMRNGIQIYPSIGLGFPSSCSPADVNAFVGHIMPKIVTSANGLVFEECSTTRSSNFDAGFWLVTPVLPDSFSLFQVVDDNH